MEAGAAGSSAGTCCSKFAFAIVSLYRAVLAFAVMATTTAAKIVLPLAVAPER